MITSVIIAAFLIIFNVTMVYSIDRFDPKKFEDRRNSVTRDSEPAIANKSIFSRTLHRSLKVAIEIFFFFSI